jgi:cell division protein FtsX
MLIPYYLYSPAPTSSTFVLINVDSFILWVGGGLTAAFIASGKIINGASNGLYSAIISGVIVIIIFYILLTNDFNNTSPLDNIAFFAVLSLVYILIPGIFSIIGGLIGISIRTILTKIINLHNK